MTITSILETYDTFSAQRLENRFFKHQLIVDLLKELPSEFEVKELGLSAQGRSINLVKWGKGKTKVMLWSQMHGDEATGTMAVFDLFNFLQRDNSLVQSLAENCELYIIPMVNPDGAAVFTRRSSQLIDINRDYLHLSTPEAKILKKSRDDIKPEFGFNLHDQITLWSVTGSLKSAMLSFLAPSADSNLSISDTRKRAMHVIADMFANMTDFAPGHIGLFKDEYEPRAFGDNFQAEGTSTILIEAGGFEDDFEKQEIRKYYFGAMISGLKSIAEKSYEQQNLDNYFNIPKNNKEIFHIMINDVMLHGITVSIGINYDEYPLADGCGTYKTFVVQDIGDLSFCDAYRIYSAHEKELKGEIDIFKNANFKLLEDGNTILSFENGNLL
jgi:hypothetical protein